MDLNDSTSLAELMSRYVSTETGFRCPKGWLADMPCTRVQREAETISSQRCLIVQHDRASFFRSQVCFTNHASIEELQIHLVIHLFVLTSSTGYTITKEYNYFTSKAAQIDHYTHLNGLLLYTNMQYAWLKQEQE